MAVSFNPKNPIHKYIMYVSLFKGYEINEEMYVDLYGDLENDKESIKLRNLNYLKIVEEIKSMQ